MDSTSSLFRSVLLGCVLALGMTVSAAAQPSVSLRGNVGASFFRSPDILSEALHSGVDLGVGVDVHLPRGVSITANGAYDQFTLNEQTARLFRSIEVGNLSFFSGSLGVRYTYRNDSDAHPYVATGLGVYHVRSSNRKLFEDGKLVEQLPHVSETKLGAHLALGSYFRLDDRYAVFFEPRYVFYEVQENLTGTLRYFNLRLGLDVQL